MDILSSIPAITSMLLDDTRAVRRSAFDMLCELLTDDRIGKTTQTRDIMESAAEVLFQALHDTNPNKRWISVEMIPLLSKYPTLHTRLLEMIPKIGSLLTDKDPIIRITTVETLAILSEIKTFHSSVILQLNSRIDLLNNSVVIVQDDAARVFVECVKFPSIFHETVMLALPHFKGLLQSPSLMLRSTAKKMVEHCAIYPSFHSCIVETTQPILSELNSQNLSTSDQKSWAWYLKYSNADALQKISQNSLSTIVSDIKSAQYDVRNWKLLALEKLASFPTLESPLILLLPKLLANLSQWDHEMLLEVLDPDEKKYNSLRNLMIRDLANTDSNLISDIFLSLTKPIVLSRECPNIGIIERVSGYAYLQNALVKAIPQFVKRALEGDTNLLIVIVELLKNEHLHEAFSDTTITSLILQTLSSHDYSPDEQSQAMKYHATFMSKPRNVSSFPGMGYPALSDTSVLEHTMLSHEAREYEYEEKIFGDGNDAGSLMQHLIQKMFSEKGVKPTRQAKALPRPTNKATPKPIKEGATNKPKPDPTSCKLAWKHLVATSGLSVGVTQSAMLFSRAEFEPPAIRLLTEFIKQPTIYAALKNNHVDDSGTESFSLNSFLHEALRTTEIESSVQNSVWIYIIRDLVFSPHLYEDLIDILPNICRNFLSGLPSAPTAYRIASIATLGKMIQNDDFLLKLEDSNNSTITPEMIFQLISAALRDPDSYIRIVALRICGALGVRDFHEKAYIHTLTTSSGIISNLMNILSDVQESMAIRYWVIKVLETYSAQSTLRMPLTQTISSLLLLLTTPASESPNSTIVPAALYILLCYARHDLWSTIRDIIAYQLNIPQNEYTIYEPSNALEDGEFQKYPFVRQTLLDPVPLILDILELGNPYKDVLPQEQISEQKSKSGSKRTRKEIMESMKSVDPTPIQVYALKCAIELLRYPSLFTYPSSTPSVYNVLLTKYTNILEGQTVLINDKTPAPEGGTSEPSDISAKAVETSAGNKTTAPTGYQSHKEEEQSEEKNTVLLGPHPILQHKAICGLKSHNVTYALYPYIAMALERVVDTIEIAIDAGNSDSWMEVRYTPTGSENREGGTKESRGSEMRPVHQMIDALCSFIFERDLDGNFEDHSESTLSYKKIITSSLIEILFERSDNVDESVGRLDVIPQYSIRDVESSRKVALLQIIGSFVRHCTNT